MFKKRERPNSASARQRSATEDDGASGAVPVADAPKRVKFGNSSESGLIGASSKRTDADEAATIEKKLLDSTLSGIKAQGIRAPTPADDVTRLLQVDEDTEKDHRAVLERNAEIDKGLKDGTLEKGVYRGMGAYKKYANQSESAIANAKYTGLLGPIRSTMSNVRSTMRVEYWGVSGDGGICKDYKETGYCGYGDSCKFLHDRSDYKQGFHLDKEWEAKQKKLEEDKRKRWERRNQRRAQAQAEGREPDESSSGEEDDSDDDDDLPKECPNCDLKWEDCSSIPIQTVCGHYFCEDCAMTQYAKTPKCIECGAPTNGIFNSCDSLEDKIKKKKAEKAEKKKGKDQQGRRNAPWQVNVDAENS